MSKWMPALIVLLIGQPLALSAQAAIKGRVVVESNRQPLSGVNLLIRSDTTLVATTVTDAQGFYSVKVPTGVYRVMASLIGYSSQEATATIAAQDVTLPAFVLKAESIQLGAVEVNAARAKENARTRAGFLVAGARMAKLEQQGARMVSAVRELNGVKVREYGDRDGRPRLCIESRRPKSGLQTNSGCPWVEIVVDGIPVGDGEVFFRTLNIADYESIEFLQDLDAQKYGSRAGQFGALALWSRGRGPFVSAERDKR